MDAIGCSLKIAVNHRARRLFLLQSLLLKHPLSRKPLPLQKLQRLLSLMQPRQPLRPCRIPMLCFLVDVGMASCRLVRNATKDVAMISHPDSAVPTARYRGVAMASWIRTNSVTMGRETVMSLVSAARRACCRAAVTESSTAASSAMKEERTPSPPVSVVPIARSRVVETASSIPKRSVMKARKTAQPPAVAARRAYCRTAATES